MMLSTPGVGKEHSLTTWVFFLQSMFCGRRETSEEQNKGKALFFVEGFPWPDWMALELSAARMQISVHSVPVCKPRALSVEVPVPACL